MRSSSVKKEDRISVTSCGVKFILKVCQTSRQKANKKRPLTIVGVLLVSYKIQTSVSERYPKRKAIGYRAGTGWNPVQDENHVFIAAS